MNAPTLLVGLGGTGSDILKRVADMVTEQERNNIAFAVFDTDINELSSIKRETPFIKTIQTSTKQTVGEYLNIDTHARDTWFPVNAILNSKTLTEGAGQVRSISRLALETVIRAGKMDQLHRAIQSLYKIEEDKEDQALRVIIVSSLAGGTGSGLVLPVAMYIRNYLATHYRHSANIMRGFFILPEVFFKVIPGQAEQNNLKANAYATLRELDAFLMKGDETLDARYNNSVKMLFPRSESSGYEEYNVRPYDFCFLFDAQNAEGVTLDSFELYKEHAASCIYSMSIGPMNKRSNSSEDNTIRKLARERGRNRYAGAGVSMLIYPFEDIKKFLALQWAKQSVSKEWLTYDNDYKEMQKENVRRRAEGASILELKRSEFYANQIESAAKHGDAFAKAIVNSCTRFGTDGVTEKGKYWTDYINSIMSKVEEDLEKGSNELESKKAKVEDLRSELDNTGDTYVDLFREELAYYNLTRSYVETTAENLAFSIFKPLKKGQTQSDQKFRIENYLTGSGGDYMHPNAIRYFLVRAQELMVRRNRTHSEELKDLTEALQRAEATIFDDEKTEAPESAIDYEGKKIAKGEQQNLKDLLSDYVRQIEEYRVAYVKQRVLERGVNYLNGMIDAFEQFYTIFDTKVDTIDEEINAIYRKYRDTKGVTTRFVCASKESLDKMLERRPYMGGAINIDNDLAKEIFLRVSSYAATKEKPSTNRFFSDLFDEGIIGYFKDSVMKTYGSEVDIDIITALENEAEYEYSGDVDELTDGMVEQYVRRTINNIRALSCPFIESPLGEQREPIYSCTFNKELKPKKGDVSARAQLVQSEMLDRGGVPDEDIPKGMLMFYQSFYGLRANDLSKFAPPERSMTDSRTAGEYYKAYFELIDGIHPEPHLSREISPHIDRWWHINTKMPDLDDENQYENEQKIYAAFFWGLLGEYIYLTSDDENLNKKVYKLDNDNLKMESSQLIVSNGTICDKLYEALDAVAIYPELTKKILERIEIRVNKDVNDSNRESIDGTILYDFFDKFRITEPILGKGAKPATSIFSIPMMMKKSVNPDEYYEENVIDLLRAEINEIDKYLTRFCNEKERNHEMRNILVDQFQKYLDDVKAESEKNENIYQETLFFRVCSIIATKFEDMEMDEERRMVVKTAEDLRRKDEQDSQKSATEKK